MDIISVQFVLLTLIAGIIYYLLKDKFKFFFLAILSCGFIASYDYKLLIYILIYSLINYFIGLKIPGAKNKIALYRTGIVINLSQLILLKYASFSIDPFFRLFNSNIQISKLSEIIIPLGVSYFTLQAIGYLINVKMGWEKPETKFQNFLLYLTFFPKFLSGPIERSNHFLPQLKGTKELNEAQVSSGMRIILFGFFKKVAIANQLAPYIFDTYDNISSLSGFSLFGIFLLLPLYLYFDFSGYTDIAIGFAKLFGIDLLPNFNRPFFAKNITNFWKRFHMSLAFWFNDYIFNLTVFRRRKWKIYSSIYALFITWILFGIWHGAGWTYLIIGLLQTLAITYEFLTKKFRKRVFDRVSDSFNTWIGRIFTYLFYAFNLIFFFAPDIQTAFDFISNMFPVTGPYMIQDITTKPFSLILYIPIILLMELIQTDYKNSWEKIQLFWNENTIKSNIFRWSVFSAMITIIYVVGLKAQQFVYVNF